MDCATTSTNAYFSRPITKGYVTSFVGYRWGKLHRGIDIGSPTGKNTPLYSIGNGVITKIWKDAYYRMNGLTLEPAPKIDRKTQN